MYTRGSASSKPGPVIHDMHIRCLTHDRCTLNDVCAMQHCASVACISFCCGSSAAVAQSDRQYNGHINQSLAESGWAFRRQRSCSRNLRCPCLPSCRRPLPRYLRDRQQVPLHPFTAHRACTQQQVLVAWLPFFKQCKPTCRVLEYRKPLIVGSLATAGVVLFCGRYQF